MQGNISRTREEASKLLESQLGRRIGIQPFLLARLERTTFLDVGLLSTMITTHDQYGAW